jgi:hypothetical protein
MKDLYHAVGAIGNAPKFAKKVYTFNLLASSPARCDPSSVSAATVSNAR